MRWSTQKISCTKEIKTSVSKLKGLNDFNLKLIKWICFFKKNKLS